MPKCPAFPRIASVDGRRPTSWRRLCLSGAVTCLTVQVAAARDMAEGGAVSGKASSHRNLHRAALKAGQKAAPPRDGTAPKAVEARSSDRLVVSSRRSLSRGAENVASTLIMKQMVPGTNVMNAVGRLPGVSFSSTDPLGIDTFGTSTYVRGFFMDQIGYTLDGIPLNDQTYESNNGVSIIQAAVQDDIAHVTVSEGPGGVEVPSTSTLGGTIQFETSDPTAKRGGKVSQSFGSYGSMRTYFRGDTGEINKTGTKAYVSFTRADEKLWMGSGDQQQKQVQAKIVQPIGHDSKIKAFFNWSSLAQWGYPDYSLAMINALGWRIPRLYPNYAKAYAYASGDLDLPYSPAMKANDDQAYLYDGGQVQIDYTGGLNLDFALTDRLRWRSVVYGQSDTGYYTYSDYDQPSLGTGAPLSMSVWSTRQERFGLTSSLLYDLDKHHIDAGVWFENNNQQESLSWYNEPVLGQGSPLATVGPWTTYGPAFKQGYNYMWHTNNFAAHIQDVWRPFKNLRLVAGFKSMLAHTGGGADYNNAAYTGVDALPNGGMTAFDAFLPHFGASWQFLPGHELYFDLAENMRSYLVLPNGGGNSLWSVQSQEIFRDLQKKVKPERDWVYTVGYRYTNRNMQASLAGYHVDASNRLQAATQGTILQPISTVAQTSVQINGVDAGLTLHPLKNVTLYNSVSYMHGTYGDNIGGAGVTYDTKGKRLVNYPDFMYKGNLAYNWRNLEAHFDVQYFSRRYFSYTNDTSVPGYWLANAGARYNFGNVGLTKDLTISFNVYNLFNTHYISMMGENGNPFVGDYQSLERGSVRQFFGTVSTRF